MKEELIARFAYIKDEDFEERDTPKRYILHRENIHKLSVMNAVLTSLVARTPTWNIS